MARSITLTLDGKSYDLAINFAAAQKIAENVIDPLALARDALTAQHFLAAGIDYDPKFQWTIENVVKILYHLMVANGEKLSYNDVGEAVMNDGPVESIQVAEQVMAMLATNGSQEAEGEKSAGK